MRHGEVSQPLKGRVIVVTGAALAGSTALIRALGAAGATLALCATVEVNGRVRSAERKGIEAMAVAVAWWDEESVRSGVSQIMAKFGHIDALVHIDPGHVFVTPGNDRVAGAITRAGAWDRGLAVYYSTVGADPVPAAAAEPGYDIGIVYVGRPATQKESQRAGGEAAAICIARLRQDAGV